MTPSTVSLISYLSEGDLSTHLPALTQTPEYITMSGILGQMMTFAFLPFLLIYFDRLL